MSRKLLTSVVCGLVGMNCMSVFAETRPKLVVGIVVDQLRTDYLENLQDLFSEGGFRRLFKEGAFIRDIDFKIPQPDVASSTAILQTGSYPRQNGIAGENIYNVTDKTIIPVFNDAAFIGNFTSETFSPASLRVTTISDELVNAGNGSTKIHTLAPGPSQAIILAGHEAKSAFWVNNETGKWSTSTYFTAPPAALQNKNYNSPLISRLDTMKWVPLLKGVDYPDVSRNRIAEGFKYAFPRSDRDVFSMYKESPLMNRDIAEAAVEYIRDLKLGKNQESSDMLGLGFTLAPFQNVTSPSDSRYELEDAYLRLDRNLEAIFNAIDRYVGMENTLVYLASTGYFNDNYSPSADSRLPGGTFSVKRAVSLLNSYLAAKFGNGSYIDTYYDCHVFLNKSVLEEKGLNLNDIAGESRDFLVRMSGVSDAYTVADLMSPSVPQLEGHRLASDPKTSGDIILEFNPGWKVIDDTRFPSVEKKQKYVAFESPAFFLGANIAPQTIEHSVDAVAIAPTVAKILRIRAPNSASDNPIILKKK